MSSEEKRSGSLVEGQVGCGHCAGSLRAPSLLASVRAFASERGGRRGHGPRQGGWKRRGPAAANKERPPFCKAGPRAAAAVRLRGAGRGPGGQAADGPEEPARRLLSGRGEARPGGRYLGGGVEPSPPAPGQRCSLRQRRGDAPEGYPERSRRGLCRRWRWFPPAVCAASHSENNGAHLPRSSLCRPGPR